MRTTTTHFSIPHDNALRLAQYLYEAGVSADHLERCFGARIEKIEDGQVVWKVIPMRIIKFKKGERHGNHNQND